MLFKFFSSSSSRMILFYRNDLRSISREWTDFCYWELVCCELFFLLYFFHHFILYISALSKSYDNDDFVQFSSSHFISLDTQDVLKNSLYLRWNVLERNIHKKINTFIATVQVTFYRCRGERKECFK